MNKTQSKRFETLAASDDDVTSEIYLDELWYIYREAKQFACFGDVLDRMRAYKMGKETEKYFESVEAKGFIPPNSSGYWLHTVDRPGWFTTLELF